MSTVKFLSDLQHVDVFDPPTPAAKHLPEYYKNMPAHTGAPHSFNDSGDPNETMKKCMPVLDSMSAGYMLTLPSDVYVGQNDDGSRSFTWSADQFTAIASHPGAQFPGLPVPDRYDQSSAYKFINPWQIVTEKNYSCLFVHPMWHYDLPFHTLSGIVDTDQHPVPVNFPFLMEKDFVGYLAKGTPIVQVIPFRRDEFVSEVGVRPESEGRRWLRAKLQFSNRYKDHFRAKKAFR